MKPIHVALLTALAFLLCGARQANADAITYTESATMTGTIGTTSFSNAMVTVAFLGDTTNASCLFVVSSGFCVNTPGAATVTIAGVGTFAFTDSMEVDVFPKIPFARIADVTLGSGGVGLDVLGTFNSAFTTYDLTTATGPLTGQAGFAPTGRYNTTGGVLGFSNASGPSTFTASFNVPEPSSLLLLGTALLALIPLIREHTRLV